MKLVRTMHRYAMHSCTLGICGGRGCYDNGQPTDRFCDCPAGDVRRRMDDGENVEVEWPACDRCESAPASPMSPWCPACSVSPPTPPCP